MRSPVQFLLRCPTASATGAQVWFELRSGGLRVLTIGMAFAIVLVLLFTSGRSGRSLGMFCAVVFVPTVLLIARNAFAIRRRQGGTFLGTFEATQPHGTTRLVIVKLLVRAACFLVALTAVWATAWICVSRFPPFNSNGEVPSAVANLSRGMLGREAAFAALPGYEQLAVVFMALVWLALWVMALAVERAIWVRDFRRVIIAVSLPLSYVVGGVAAANHLMPRFLVPVLDRGIRWGIEAAMVATTIYLLRSCLAERLFSRRYVWGVLLISAAFAAAWVTVLHVNGVQFARMPPMSIDGVLWPVLLPPLACVLAPWAFNRVRHL